MGLLTTAQKAAIVGEKPTVYQRVDIYIPQAAGNFGLNTDDYLIHHDLLGPRLVEDFGRLVVEAYNQSMAKPGKLSAGHWSFTCDNSSGLFYPSATANCWYNSAASYQADPVECRLEHRVYVWTSAGWSELTMLYYYGHVQGVTYDDNKKLATIEAKAMAALELERRWTEDDADTTDTGLDVVL